MTIQMSLAPLSFVFSVRYLLLISAVLSPRSHILCIVVFPSYPCVIKSFIQSSLQTSPFLSLPLYIIDADDVASQPTFERSQPGTPAMAGRDGACRGIPIDPSSARSFHPSHDSVHLIVRSRG